MEAAGNLLMRAAILRLNRAHHVTRSYSRRDCDDDVDRPRLSAVRECHVSAWPYAHAICHMPLSLKTYIVTSAILILPPLVQTDDVYYP